MNLLMQCPGCWSYSLNDEDRSWECECGEALQVIDLRDPHIWAVRMAGMDFTPRDVQILTCAMAGNFPDQFDADRMPLLRRLATTDKVLSAAAAKSEEDR